MAKSHFKESQRPNTTDFPNVISTDDVDLLDSIIAALDAFDNLIGTSENCDNGLSDLFEPQLRRLQAIRGRIGR
jgi:hypothetical protein